MRSFRRFCTLEERVQQLVPLFYPDQPTFNTKIIRFSSCPSLATSAIVSHNLFRTATAVSFSYPSNSAALTCCLVFSAVAAQTVFVSSSFLKVLNATRLSSTSAKDRTYTSISPSIDGYVYSLCLAYSCLFGQLKAK